MTRVELAGGVVVAVGSPSDDATFTLTEAPCDDRRTITVPSVSDALAELTERCQRWPQAAAVCVDVLRSVDPTAPTRVGVITESLAYSTLQSGPEFARWLMERGLDAKRRNWLGITMLHRCAAKGDTGIAEVCLEYGAEIDAIETEWSRSQRPRSAPQ